MKVSSQADAIYQVLNKYRKNPYSLKYDGAVLLNKISEFITQDKPLKMIIPACHGKVDIAFCVFNHLPDLGDYLGIKNFANMCEEITKIYPRGIELIMLHEAHFYVGLLVKSDETANAYLTQIRQLIAEYPFIKSMALNDFFPELNSFAACREKFFAETVPSFEEVINLIKSQARYKTLYVAYKKIYRIFNTNYDKKAVKQNALLQMQIYLGFGKLVAKHFNDVNYIRLSTLYKDPSVKDQVAVNYLPNKHHLATPSFHCVVKFKNGEYDFIKRQEAVDRGYEICYEYDLPYFAEVG